ncbi:MAG TPA: hypothetical protein VIM28_04365 [Solirubrobacterales bacterium]
MLDHDVLVAMERGGRPVDHPVKHHLGIELPRLDPLAGGARIHRSGDGAW